MAVEWSSDLMRELHRDLCAWMGAGVLPYTGWVIGMQVLVAMSEKRSLDVQVNWGDFWDSAVTLDGKPYVPPLGRVVDLYPTGIPDELQQYLGLLFDTCPLRLANKKQLARESVDDKRPLQSVFLEADLEDQTSIIEVMDLPLYISYAPDIGFDPSSVDVFSGVKTTVNLTGF